MSASPTHLLQIHVSWGTRLDGVGKIYEKVWVRKILKKYGVGKIFEKDGMGKIFENNGMR